MSLDIPEKIYKIVLNTVHEKVIPYMVQPLILMDWLSESFNRGGECAILSLNGLFVLITKYNLDYPDFYTKLYSLITPNLFNQNIDLFFKHLQIFLSSSMLPVYLTAAFIKKLARLSLIAPPSFCLLTYPLIYNLMIDNPSTKVLVDRIPESAQKSLLKLNHLFVMENDPFDPNEADLKKANAINSSLWELIILMKHIIPSITSVTRFFKSNVNRGSRKELTDYMEKSYQGLFEEELTRKVKRGVPTAYAQPTALFSSSDFPGWDFGSNQ